MTAAELLASQVPAPSAMLSRDWERVQAEVKGRAFFMASVMEAEVLSVFQKYAVDVTAGKLGKAEAREKIRVDLARLGYVPKPGTEGSIKDLRSARRINTVIDTNMALVSGAVAYDMALEGEAFYPAKKLVRVSLRKDPRNWPQRWNKAAAGLPKEGQNAAALAAHVRHPVWRAISDFDRPHPPYAWGSGMGDLPLRKDKAEALGVDTLALTPVGEVSTPAQTHRAAAVIKPDTNDGLSMAAAVPDAAMRAALAAKLKGTAVWEKGQKKDGWRLVYRDPNGTAPLRPEELPPVVTAQPVEGAPTYQADAARRYLEEGPKGFSAGSDALYDFARLVHRVKPGAAGSTAAPAPLAPLWHARAFGSEDEAQFFISMLDEGTTPRAGWPFIQCASDAALALADLDRSRAAVPGGGVPVVFVIRGCVSGRDLRPLLRALSGAEEAVPGVFLEAGTRLRVLSVEEVRGMRTVICEEVKL